MLLKVRKANATNCMKFSLTGVKSWPSPRKSWIDAIFEFLISKRFRCLWTKQSAGSDRGTALVTFETFSNACFFSEHPKNRIGTNFWNNDQLHSIPTFLHRRSTHVCITFKISSLEINHVWSSACRKIRPPQFCEFSSLKNFNINNVSSSNNHITLANS